MKLLKGKIELIMAEKGLTNSEVADLAGISRHNLSTIRLRGTCMPFTAGKIARALGVDVTEIVVRED